MAVPGTEINKCHMIFSPSLKIHMLNGTYEAIGGQPGGVGYGVCKCPEYLFRAGLDDPV
ncbi:hypothetical protein D9M69_703390 [compost metagenome]